MVTTVQVCTIVTNSNPLFSLMILDINECNITFNGGCSQTCINTPGTYTCSCNSGYILKIDGHSCVG